MTGFTSSSIHIGVYNNSTVPAQTNTVNNDYRNDNGDAALQKLMELLPPNGVKNRQNGFAYTVTQIAELWHEVQRLLRRFRGNANMPSWADTTEENQQTGIYFVQLVIDNPLITAEQHHAEWCAYKAELGWRYGKTLNYETRERPDMCPYTKMSDLQKTTCALMVTMIKTLLPMIQY